MTSLDITVQASLRKAALAARGGAEGAQWFTWPTASAVLDPARGVLLIVTDLEPSPDCWDAVCRLLELAGYDNQSIGRWTADPGEPVELAGLATLDPKPGSPGRVAPLAPD